VQAEDKNLGKTPDLQTSKSYVYKRMKLWVPAELRPDLVWRPHHAITAGHGGLHKSLAKLRQFSYWPGMAVDVQKVVKNCEVCKITKTANKNDRPPMGKQRVTERAGRGQKLGIL